LPKWCYPLLGVNWTKQMLRCFYAVGAKCPEIFFSNFQKNKRGLIFLLKPLLLSLIEVFVELSEPFLVSLTSD